MKQAPIIFNYNNYRMFLADYYHFKKKSSSSFSYRQFSKKCGFKSPNFLKLVIDGQRNLSIDSIEKFVITLKLQTNEAEFFRTLVQFNQEKRDSEKQVLFKKLQSLAPYQNKRNIDVASFEYLSHWLYPVLREMVLLPDFRDDPYWIARRLSGRTSCKEIQHCLQFLIRHGFIIKNQQGQYECAERIVTSSDEVKSLAIREYHRKALRQGCEMIEDLDLLEREFGALIFSLPTEKIEELKKRLKNFRHEIHQWAIEQESKDDLQVVQFNLQMFPQTKRAK